MVLDQVAHRAGAVVVAGAGADPEVLGGGDLDVVDVVAVPQRLEHPVGEAERHDVLDRLLAQVVVDAEDLLLVEDRQHLAVELHGLLERRPERLLDDHPHVGALDPVQALLAELADDHREERRRRREVEAAVQALVGLLVEGVHGSREPGVQLALVERAGDVPRVPNSRVGRRRRARGASTCAPRRSRSRGTPRRSSPSARSRRGRSARAAARRARGCRAPAGACGWRGRPSHRRSRASSVRRGPHSSATNGSDRTAAIGGVERGASGPPSAAVDRRRARVVLVEDRVDLAREAELGDREARVVEVGDRQLTRLFSEMHMSGRRW